MFERFDEDARKSLFFARAAASKRQSDNIDAADLLLGVMLVKPSAVLEFATPGFAAESLTKGDTAEGMVARFRNDAAFQDATRVEIRFAKRVVQALEHALEEANALDQAEIRPEHLILGVLRDEGTPAWKTLRGAGVSLREMRRRLAGGLP